MELNPLKDIEANIRYLKLEKCMETLEKDVADIKKDMQDLVAEMGKLSDKYIQLGNQLTAIENILKTRSESSNETN